ncbi:MAG: hypothetical protein R3338_15065, partial [Thermoanaerobaculia bacterium]|nr:hypothetical protein [Thermoanaerobaculia bacterium]
MELSQGTSRRNDIWALAGLAGLVTLFFWKPLFGLEIFFDRDLSQYYYPSMRVLREILLQGEFPFWSHYFSGGQPLAANPEYAVFYPPRWLILLPDYDLGFNLHIIVHFYIATAGMYLFLRSRSMSIVAPLLGAAAFGLGGWMVSSTDLLPIMFGMAWIPWILLFATRFVAERRAWLFVLASIASGLQALTGEPTTLIQSAILTLLVVTFDADRDFPGWGTRLRRSVAASGVVVAGALVGAVQL